MNNIAPSYLRKLLQLREIRRRCSRLDDDFFILKIPSQPQFSRTEAAFTYSGPKVWNELPFLIRSASSLETFKTILKTYYFEIAFAGVE